MKFNKIQKFEDYKLNEGKKISFRDMGISDLMDLKLYTDKLAKANIDWNQKGQALVFNNANDAKKAKQLLGLDEGKLTEAKGGWALYIDGEKIKSFRTKKEALRAYKLVQMEDGSVELKAEGKVNEGKGKDLADKVMKIAAKDVKTLNGSELMEFRKWIAKAFDMKEGLNEGKSNIMKKWDSVKTMEADMEEFISNGHDASGDDLTKDIIDSLSKMMDFASSKMNESGKQVECPKCSGEGCSHCDDKGYHINEEYVESMNSIELANLLGQMKNLWDEWKNGPLTEPSDIKPAQKELIGWITRWMKKEIK